MHVNPCCGQERMLGPLELGKQRPHACESLLWPGEGVRTSGTGGAGSW